jgi:hypothetical protein
MRRRAESRYEVVTRRSLDTRPPGIHDLDTAAHRVLTLTADVSTLDVTGMTRRSSR